MGKEIYEQLLMELWSNIFLTDPYAADSATCTIPLHTWRQVTEQNPGARLFGEITLGEKKIYAALGVPNAETEGGSEKLYLPRWMLEQLDTLGEGEIAEVQWLSQEAFPEATRIVVRPHDSAFYHANAKEELERCLTRLGVLRQGDTISLNLECLGGFEILFDIVLTEPANLVLAEGDEVVMEFEAALDAPPEPSPRPDTPIPIHEEPVSMSSMLPEPVEKPGVVLGGEERLMPDGRRWNPWRDGPWSKD